MATLRIHPYFIIFLLTLPLLAVVLPFCFNGRSYLSKSFAAREKAPASFLPSVLGIKRLPCRLRRCSSRGSDSIPRSFSIPSPFFNYWFREIRVDFHSKHHGSIPSMESEDSSRSCSFRIFTNPYSLSRFTMDLDWGIYLLLPVGASVARATVEVLIDFVRVLGGPFGVWLPRWKWNIVVWRTGNWQAPRARPSRMEVAACWGFRLLFLAHWRLLRHGGAALLFILNLGA